MKNILVTGACGFIGSNFINYMSEKYKDSFFVGLDILDYCSSLKNVNNNTNIEMVIGNIANKELVAYLLRKYKIDTIVHFAAQSHVDNSFFNSVSFTENNVLATHILLETTRVYQLETNNLARFLAVSTDEVTGQSAFGEKHTEDSIFNPTNPYSSSKCCAEFLVQSYIKSYNLPCLISRGNNCYGENQYPEKVIPKFICQLLNGEKVTIQGDGSALRNFVHAWDTCTAMETILLNGKVGEIYNIGGSCEHSVMNIAKLLIRLIHGTDNIEEYITFVPDRTFNDCRYYISSDKLEGLGWKPEKTEFEEEVIKLIEWYKENKNRYGF